MNAARICMGTERVYSRRLVHITHQRTMPREHTHTHTREGGEWRERLTVLFLVVGELEFTTQVGLSLSRVSLAGQGTYQQEKPEEEHLADWGESSLTAGTWEAATPESLSPPPGEGCTGVEAPSLLWQQRIAG